MWPQGQNLNFAIPADVIRRFLAKSRPDRAATPAPRFDARASESPRRGDSLRFASNWTVGRVDFISKGATEVALSVVTTEHTYIGTLLVAAPEPAALTELANGSIVQFAVRQREARIVATDQLYAMRVIVKQPNNREESVVAP